MRVVRSTAQALVVSLLLSSLTGCSWVVGRMTRGVADNLTSAVLAQNDAELVRDGAPAYLIAIDGLIEGDPESEMLLLSGARLYSAYASAFVEDEERASRLTLRAKSYGNRALCTVNRPLCEVAAKPGNFDVFSAELAKTNRKQVDALYGYGTAWATWIQANSGDWNAIAEIPKVEAMMERVVELDDEYDEGGAHLALGIAYTLRPASMGGKPDAAKVHFERAIELSKGRNLMAKYLFARQYARLVFDRELHDRLLREVLEADPESPGYTLMNTMAQEQAQVLLDEAEEYF